jgi:transcriptional regulator with XRE-family HTH domain
MPDSALELTLGRRLLALREARRLSLRTLAERVGLSASFLSQVERDETSPSIASLEKIAQALGVDLASLFSQFPADPVVRAAERSALPSPGTKTRLASLSRTAGMLAPRLLTLLPDSFVGFMPGERTETFLTVLEGQAKVRLVTGETELAAGDSLHALPEHQLLELANTSAERALLLIVNVAGS